MSENNSFSGRFKRYARVSGAVSGVAAKAVGGRVFGMKFDKAEHAKEIQLALGGLKGPLMKVAQILSTIPDVLPDEYTQELIKLQNQCTTDGVGVCEASDDCRNGTGLAVQVRGFRT